MKNAALLVLLSVVVAGCMTDAERLELLSHQGQRKLDSLLGVKIGEVFPGDSDVDKTSLTNLSPHWVRFETNRKFMDAPWFLNGVGVTTNGNVYKVSSMAFQSTPQQDKEREARDRQSTAYSLSMTADSHGYVSGTLTPRSPSTSFYRAQMDFGGKRAAAVREMLEQKYGKKGLFKGDNWMSTCIFPFEDGRKIILKNSFGSISLEAVDERLEAEAKNQEAAEKAKTTGINAL